MKIKIDSSKVSVLTSVPSKSTTNVLILTPLSKKLFYLKYAENKVKYNILFTSPLEFDNFQDLFYILLKTRRYCLY